MSVTVTYPGVYIEEFTPGAPIQGVGTSTAAFVGTAAKGPIRAPTLVQSWDAFQNTFGGFITEQPVSFLAPAVYGFFLNGGTACYVVRVGTGTNAVVNLERSGTNATALVVRARQEGLVGNSLSAVVSYPSMATLSVQRTEATISAWALSGERTTLTVTDSKGFVAGDRVHLTKGTDTDDAIVDEVKDATTLVVAKKLANDFSSGKVRTANLTAGQRSIRLAVPADKRLSQSIPPGSTVQIADSTPKSDIRTVESAGGDTILLTEGLSREFELGDATKLPSITPLVFDLVLRDSSGHRDPFLQLAMNANHPNYWGGIASMLVTIEEPATTSSPGDPRPKAGTFSLSGGTADDRAEARSILLRDTAAWLDLLKPYDEVAIVCIPGATDRAAQQAIVAHCDGMKDRFAILDSIRDATLDAVSTQFGDVRSEGGYAALYYPWIMARNPATGKDEAWPPCGHIAGAFARTDGQQGVHKAPANTNLRGALGLERRLTDNEQGPLNLTGINVLRVFPGQGQPLIWGARTTATNRNWQYVNIRRLFMFLEESIAEGIRWAVFEPNNLQLWQKLKRSITEFLTRVWRAGALFGDTPEKAFYVRIDEVLNPPAEQKLGRLNIEIGVRPTYAAEFIVVRIGIWDGGSQVSEG